MTPYTPTTSVYCGTKRSGKDLERESRKRFWDPTKCKPVDSRKTSLRFEPSETGEDSETTVKVLGRRGFYLK